MACINMFNNDQQNNLHSTMPMPMPMGPRISFSNDFSDTPIKHEIIYREAPVSSDFAFSVSDHNMISAADDLFCKGKLLPTKTTTLRDELLVDNDNDDDYVDSSPRLSKATTGRWRERFGLTRKSHISQKKVVADNCLGRIDETMSMTTLSFHAHAGGGDTIDLKGFY